jgi:hypothetical protein
MGERHAEAFVAQTFGGDSEGASPEDFSAKKVAFHIIQLKNDIELVRLQLLICRQSC